MSTTTTDFKPSLGLLDATMIVAGSMIGSGIFIVSADITRNVGSAGWLVAVWLITGFMTLTAALKLWRAKCDVPKSRRSVRVLKRVLQSTTWFFIWLELFFGNSNRHYRSRGCRV